MGRLEQLFKTFSTNLEFYAEKYAGQFCCPICLRVFNMCDPSQLSEAHIIPKALGGRIVTLTCRECNSRVGYQVESHEIERARYIRAVSGDTNIPLKVRLKMSHQDIALGRATAEMRFDKSEKKPHLQFKIIEKASNPEEISEIHQCLEQNRDKGLADIELSINGKLNFNWNRWPLTYLHIAFLFLFHEFGYEWVLDQCASHIRKQLIEPENMFIKLPIWKIKDSPRNSDRMSVSLIKKPEHAKGFLVIIPKLTHLPSRLGVWMPFFGNSYDPPETKEGDSLDLIGLPPNHLFLANKDYVGYCHYAVNHFDS